MGRIKARVLAALGMTARGRVGSKSVKKRLYKVAPSPFLATGGLGGGAGRKAVEAGTCGEGKGLEFKTICP